MHTKYYDDSLVLLCVACLLSFLAELKLMCINSVYVYIEKGVHMVTWILSLTCSFCLSVCLSICLTYPRTYISI